MAILGAWHFSFTVSDLDAAVAFYCELLDFTVIRRARNDSEYIRGLVGYRDAVLEIAQLAAPGPRTGLADHDLELVRYVVPSGRRVADPEIRHPGEAHLAIAVDDLDVTYARLRDAGIAFFSTPNDITTGANKGGKACYCLGPDAIVHELVQPPWAGRGSAGPSPPTA